MVDVRDVVHCMFTLMQKSIFGQRFILNSENLMFKEILSVPQKNLDTQNYHSLKSLNSCFELHIKLNEFCVFLMENNLVCLRNLLRVVLKLWRILIKK